MTEVAAHPAGVLLVSVAGVVAGMAVGAARREARVGFAVMLELWTAASLLRLSVDATWLAIGASAMLVVLRKVAGTALRDSPP
jgi:hypothetical protein